MVTSGWIQDSGIMEGWNAVNESSLFSSTDFWFKFIFPQRQNQFFFSAGAFPPLACEVSWNRTALEATAFQNIMKTLRSLVKGDSTGCRLQKPLSCIAWLIVKIMHHDHSKAILWLYTHVSNIIPQPLSSEVYWKRSHYLCPFLTLLNRPSTLKCEAIIFQIKLCYL